MINKLIEISDEVKSAIENKSPIVALESTIISHGMPYPQNLTTALKIEDTVRNHGAVPATIAIINGKIKIGLNKSEIEYLSKEKNILKASRRDIPVIVTRRLNAATTVSATMFCASLAGIKIFATGGIGGVHRNAGNTFDISADLVELSKTNVAVVSSGVKSILDIGLTLEYLETLGVPVIGYKTEEFPAFFTRESGFKVNYILDSPKEIADAINTKWELGLKGGLLIANAISREYSVNKELIDDAINKALKSLDKVLKSAEQNNITGKDITPFLLAEVNKITRGKSLEANIKLVLNNAELAAKISLYL
ncbi:MAG: pseudouridine-5'-phosphate glycosidase [Ignavibacteria bacterium]|nr:pseudouridine-5'-phosphate glycosidase [Ignavibacteria bacterium]